MKTSPFLLCAFLITAAPAAAGTIQGTVVNTSSGKPVPCQVTVTLQVLAKGEFIPVKEAIPDTEGRFRFDRLPIRQGHVYKVGATRHGIFYPGPQIRLTELQPDAATNLSVCDATVGPSPLVLKKMDVTIRPETGMLKVTESLLIDNPSHTCYCGAPAPAGMDPITLALSIPPDFERTTFDQEFFGRRFVVINNKVVTSIPWPPGERELRYTYVIRTTQELSSWKRAIDLPCSDVTIHVEGKSPGEVRCELLKKTTADEKAVAFASAGQELAAGQVVQVELGRLPLPWMAYGKWAALGIMLAVIAVAGWFQFRRRSRLSPVKERAEASSDKNEKKKAA